MTVFVDRDKLSPRHIPSRLPHRERQIDLAISFFRDFLEGKGGRYTRIIQFVGPIGVGKTCTAHHVAKALKTAAAKIGLRLLFAYLNLRLEAPSKYVLYRSLAYKIDPCLESRSLSPKEQLLNVIRYVKATGSYLLLVVDEIDEFLKKSSEEGLVYDLTRLSELYPGERSGVMGLVFIARSLDWRSLLSDAEKSTLGNLMIGFKPYSRDEVYDILEYRASEAFRKGAVGPEVLEYISEATVRHAGSDIRYALDVLLYSGVLAENEGETRVTLDHVRAVLGSFDHVLTSRDIAEMNTEEKLVLLSVARALKMTGKQYVALKEVRSSLRIICEQYNINPMSEGLFEDVLQKLYEEGMVDIKGVAKIGISRMPVEKLSLFLDEIIGNITTELIL